MSSLEVSSGVWGVSAGFVGVSAGFLEVSGVVLLGSCSGFAGLFM